MKALKCMWRCQCMLTHTYTHMSKHTNFAFMSKFLPAACDVAKLTLRVCCSPHPWKRGFPLTLHVSSAGWRLSWEHVLDSFLSSQQTHKSSHRRRKKERQFMKGKGTASFSHAVVDSWIDSVDGKQHVILLINLHRLLEHFTDSCVRYISLAKSQSKGLFHNMNEEKMYKTLSWFRKHAFFPDSEPCQFLAKKTKPIPRMWDSLVNTWSTIFFLSMGTSLLFLEIHHCILFPAALPQSSTACYQEKMLSVKVLLAVMQLGV